MGDELWYAFLRRKKADWGGGPGLTQAEVDEGRAVLEALRSGSATVPEILRNPTGLTDAGVFFARVRAHLGPLSQSQIDGFQRLLQAFGVAAWPIAWAAYGLATGWWETNKRMQPVEEGYYLGAKAAAFQRKLRYYPYFGRGDVQLTWRGDDREPHYGYARADAELGLNGELLKDPSLALRPDISAKVMVRGMEAGWFTGKTLSDYLPHSGAAAADAFRQARRIINGQDKAAEIAGIAAMFQAALEAGGWR